MTMGPFLMRFHIRDLEQFTGVKAHTIRIWEKRYGLLKPGRTDTNIRTYDIGELKTILNVAYLNQHGHKISRIAAMPEADRERAVRSMVEEQGQPEGIIQTLVLATLSFDEDLFERTCDEHERAHGFRGLMEDVLARLLERIGVLWQSNAICPAQEHFASNLIRHRIIAATQRLPMNDAAAGPVHVLFLPENEIHEIGLLYINHLLRLQGRRTVYLGQSVPQGDLLQLTALLDGPILFIGLSVINPPADTVLGYLKALRDQHPERARFLLAGAPLKGISPSEIPEGMTVLQDLAGLIQAIAPKR